jgi:hypothetical protein
VRGVEFITAGNSKLVPGIWVSTEWRFPIARFQNGGDSVWKHAAKFRPKFDLLLRRRYFHALKYFVDGRGKIVHACARDNDGVTTAMRLFSDAQKFPTLVLAELDIEMFALDLKLLCLDDVIHFLIERWSVVISIIKMEEQFSGFG